MESKEDIVVEYAGGGSRDAAVREFDLFVVHAAADGEFVHGYLLPALNLPLARVLLVDKLTPGSPIVSEIERGVSRSRFTVVVLSPAYLADRWAIFGAQLASYVSIEDVHVIPLRLMDGKLPIDLEFRVSLDFTDQVRWESEVARLRELLHTTAPASEQIVCPYPGMRPFATNEANRFFGRDGEIEDLIGRLDRGEREIYVIGPSGSGKSSLVQAGLLHALDTGSSRLERSFCVCAMRPGERPTDRLTKVLEGSLATPAETFGALVARHPPAERVLVFIDQFEEIFALADDPERQRFLAMLLALRAEPRCYLLLTLRADFFGAFMDSELWPHLAGRISRLEIAPLRGAALAQAITEPAMRVGVHLEARLSDRLVADAASEPGALPHVQETLRLLWEQRRHRLLGLAEYEALGDGGRALDVAIARRADTTMRALTLTQQVIARRVLLRLVSFGEGRSDTRRQQERQALRSAADDAAEFSGVLQRLIDDRLVTADGAADADDELVDLSHEALITAWPSLRDWIAQRRAGEQQRRRLEEKVSEWIERGRPAARLLDPEELSEAVQWMQSDAAQELGYGSELPELVAASKHEIESAERLRRRRTFRAFAILSVFSVAVSILGIIAWRQRQEAHRLVAMIYMEQGRILLHDGHPMQALPYFVVARSQGIESRPLRKLFAEASGNMSLVTFVGHDRLVTRVAFSPNATRVVTISNDKMAEVWDASMGMQITPPLRHQGAIVAAVFSPDGARVITASEDKSAQVWETSTGRPVIPPLNHQGIVSAIAFSPDGKRVVTGSRDRTARVWDAGTGRPVTSPLKHQGEIKAVAFSPDGTRVVTASLDRTARVWDAGTGEPLTPPLKHHGFVTAVVFSKDGTSVVTASLDETVIWDAGTGKPVAPPLEHHRVVATGVFSPDGTRVIIASDDETAQIWDIQIGKPVGLPLKHQKEITDAAFSPDGTRVVTASKDKTAQVWDAATGMRVTSPLEHQDEVTAVMFSPDSTRVITTSLDKMVRIWDASTNTAVTQPRKLGYDPWRWALDRDDADNDSADDALVDMGSLEDWRLLARCCPFVLVDNVPKANLHPVSMCPRY